MYFKSQEVKIQGINNQPTIAFPVIDYMIPDFALEVAEETGTLAAEITLTSANINRAHGVIKRLMELGKVFNQCEIRFHLKPLPQYDFVASDNQRVEATEKIKKVVNFLTEKIAPCFLTIHSPGIWDSEVFLNEAFEDLKALCRKAMQNGVVICLENMASGWTSDPERLIEVADKSGVSIVLDIGHFNSSECCRFNLWHRREVVEALGVFTVGAHIYEYEHNGHIPAKDHYLLWDALEALFLTKASWWVIEHNDRESFFDTYSIIKEFLEYKKGGR